MSDPSHLNSVIQFLTESNSRTAKANSLYRLASGPNAAQDFAAVPRALLTKELVTHPLDTHNNQTVLHRLAGKNLLSTITHLDLTEADFKKTTAHGHTVALSIILHGDISAVPQKFLAQLTAATKRELTTTAEEIASLEAELAEPKKKREKLLRLLKVSTQAALKEKSQKKQNQTA